VHCEITFPEETNAVKMRVVFIPLSERNWENFFRTQTGHGFSGLQYQQGAGLGSLFKGLFRTVLPFAKSIGKSVGREALSTGASIAGDILEGKSAKKAIKRRAKTGGARLLRKGAKKLKGAKLQGHGLGVRPKSKPRTKPVGKAKGKKKKNTDQLGTYYT